jgi:hypothetical protein
LSAIIKDRLLLNASVLFRYGTKIIVQIECNFIAEDSRARHGSNAAEFKSSARYSWMYGGRKMSIFRASSLIAFILSLSKDQDAT